MEVGKIIYSILMQGAAIFKRDSDESEKSVTKLGASAETSSKKVSKAGEEVDALGKKAKGAKAPLDEAAKAAEGVGKKSDESKTKVKGFRQEISQLSDDGRRAATQVGAAALGIGAAIALVGGLAISTYSEFDAAMSRTAAATMAATHEQEQLAEAAVDAGADTIYSAREAADAETELAKAGLSVKNILTGGLTGSLALAAAGQLDVARAAEIAAITLKQFNLDGTQTGRVADVLAAGAGKAVGSVDDLANGLKFVGPIASAMGISLEDTVGVLALFADQGIIGEQAGTSFRGMLSSLTSPSKIAREEIARLGITLYDEQGNFLGMQNAAQQLQDAYGGMTAQARDASLGILFGNEQITAARILYKAGAQGVDEYADAVKEQGYAAKQAWEMTNNLTGDVERLGGALDSALIQTGAPANDALREMVQLLTVLVDSYSELPEPVQTAGLYIGAGATAVALLAGGLLIAVPRIAEFRTSVKTLATEMPRSTAAVKGFAGFLGGPWGIAITAATTILGLFIQKQLDGKVKAEQYKTTLDEVTGAITAQTRAATAANLAADGDWWSVYGSDSAADAAKKLGVSLDTVTDAVYDNAAAMKEIQDLYDLFYSSGTEGASERGRVARELGMSVADTSRAVAQLYDGVKGERDAIASGQQTKQDEIELNGEVADSTDEAAKSAKTAAGAYLDAADGASTLLDELNQLLAVINESNSKGQDAITSNIAYRDSMAEIDDVIRKAAEGVDENQDGVADYTATLDQNSQAGRQNMGMLVDLAKNARDAAQAQFDLDGNADAFRQSLEDGHQAVVDRAIALGLTADEAQTLADNIAGIPTETEWTLVANTASAAMTIAQIASYWENRGINIPVSVLRQDEAAANRGADGYADGGKVNFYANGGRENHIAQFARAGTIRVWAEPETEGEYYVPMAKSKRPRSERIARQMVNEMGFDMVPRGAQSFADGGRFGDFGGAGYVDQSQTTVQLYGSDVDADDVAYKVDQLRSKRARAAG